MKPLQKSALGTCVLGISVLAAYTLPGLARPETGNDRPPGAPPAQDSHGPRDGRPPHHDGSHHDGPPIERMSRVLDLTPEQQKKITAITDKMRAEMRRLHESTRTQIDAVLTPAQRAKMKEMREQHGPPGGPHDRRPPRGERPPGDGDHRPPADDR